MNDKFTHFCPDWDNALIDNRCKEFEACTCDKEEIQRNPCLDPGGCCARQLQLCEEYIRWQAPCTREQRPWRERRMIEAIVKYLLDPYFETVKSIAEEKEDGM